MKSPEFHAEKFARAVAGPAFRRLPALEQDFLRRQAAEYLFSHEELRQILEIAIDLHMWGESSLCTVWREAPKRLPPKRRRASILASLHGHRERLRNAPRVYGPGGESVAVAGAFRAREVLRGESAATGVPAVATALVQEKARLGLGACPVASERTRCCNLATLDLVENCGFGCTYCSIRSFYSGQGVRFDRDIGAKLRALALDPSRIHHIGTGQSSDSLLWGNRFGMLDALMDFARRHPNLILELKSKSKNIAYLLANPVPRNVICTWSLNPEPVIANEEPNTASLAARIGAARRLADRGILIGFHLHPMIYYAGWEGDYDHLIDRLIGGFDPSEVAMVSLGTLTFTKSAVRGIRESGIRSRILEMPLVESDGKLSYPDALKLALFSRAYRRLSPWHGRAFTYLCMENQRLWRPALGFEYPSNRAFEEAMKASYLAKIQDGQRAP